MRAGARLAGRAARAPWQAAGRGGRAAWRRPRRTAAIAVWASIAIVGAGQVGIGQSAAKTLQLWLLWLAVRTWRHWRAARRLDQGPLGELAAAVREQAEALERLSRRAPSPAAAKAAVRGSVVRAADRNYERDQRALGRDASR